MSSELVPVEGELIHTNTLFGTDDPAEVVRRASELAAPLANLIRKQNLIVRIGQGEHVRVEGWTLLGSMLGVFPVVEWTRPVLDLEGQPIGWEARVEARTRAGEVVGAAEAECLRDERTWKGRDDYALRSMAQTRAVSKALRLPLGFVMQLAGFDPTPAEEMPSLAGAGNPPVTSEAPARITPRDDDVEFAPEAKGSEPVTEEPSKPTVKQKKLLDLLVKGGDNPPPLKRVWATIARSRVRSTDALILELGGVGDDGELHWSPLRDSLTRAEAHDLIDRLEKLEPS